MLLEHADDLVFCESALSHGYWMLKVALDRSRDPARPWPGRIPYLQLSMAELWGSLQLHLRLVGTRDTRAPVGEDPWGASLPEL